MPQEHTISDDAGPRIQVTMPLEYARSASEALDFWNRMCLGQIEELEYLIRSGTIPMHSRIEGERKSAPMEVCDVIREKLMEIKDLLGYAHNGSMGIGHRNMSKSGLASYELKKVIDKTLAYHSNPKPDFKGVNYDGLTVRYTTLPAPTAKIVMPESKPAAGPSDTGF